MPRVGWWLLGGGGGAGGWSSVGWNGRDGWFQESFDFSLMIRLCEEWGLIGGETADEAGSFEKNGS